jgi:hypothetical protein
MGGTTMKRLLAAATAAFALAAAASAFAQTGGSYGLTWHAIGGGGTTGGTGGSYHLNGLAGQPAAHLTGGGYVLDSGFWSPSLTFYAGVPASPALPTRVALYAPWPNPVAGSAAITFDLPRASRVVLQVLDVNGRVVRHLVDADMAAGQRHAEWDGRTEAGDPVAPGVYVIQLRGDGVRSARRIVHL